ncbi:MAG TPA: TRAP transporter large permease [Candidatus Desulfovibrio intestinavium]|uniref:TRAP transporter large permease n=1 Tax=Candidatus Desulfovibrio intestinavium TaxID=2838534 RepID=A0A9D2HP92_9BACT|nr:TRAP transporter large permease [Candidatus Desulfovibrio intestinavium]
MDTTTILSLALIVLFFLIGTPLSVTFSIGSIIIMIHTMGFPVGNISQIFYTTISGYPLLAMPFFIFAGNAILSSGGMGHLRDFMNRLVGHLPGGMAVAICIFAAFLGSISGSATACLAIIGTIFVPMLAESGYSRAFASGLAVTSAGLGAVIPPSVFMIIFGASNRISIADLFAAGVGPGLLAALLMCVLTVIISLRRGYYGGKKASTAERLDAFRKALPILLMPIIVLGGIYSGIFSPTQAASVACVYSLLLGVFIYKGITWRVFLNMLVETVRLSSMIYFLVIGGELFGRVLGYVGLPQMISQWVINMHLGPTSFLFAVQALLLVMGFFFSSFPMVVIVLPLFLPSVMALGIDPALYGALAVFCAIIGEVTPPMGPQLWIAAPICKEKIGNIMRESWAFLGVQVLTLGIVTVFPQISLFLVNLMR